MSITSTGIDLLAGVATNNDITGTATATRGVNVGSNGEARSNRIEQFATGVSTNAGIVRDNQIRNHRDAGIRVQGSSLVTGNYIANNATGISIVSGGSTIKNNVLDRNSVRGLLNINNAASQSRFENNTIYQPIGSAIELNSFRNYLSLLNNIIWAGGDYAIKDSFDSQTGFQSDYNLFNLSNSTVFSNWQGATISTLRDWTYRVGHDAHSLQSDPLFLDAANGVFTLLPTSPAINAGDPTSSYLNEPQGGGGRIDLGHTGNSSLATNRAGPTIQILTLMIEGASKQVEQHKSPISLLGWSARKHSCCWTCRSIMGQPG